MSGANEDDLERLASRIAMLVGDDGEAEAAGRAVGGLSRKLGLTGGHLKTIFMAGAGRLGAAARQANEQGARADRHAAEASGLQHSLEQVDYALRQARRERDALSAEIQRLREALERSRTGRQVQAAVAIVVVVAIVGAGAFAWFGPTLRPGVRDGDIALVREGGAVVLAEADPAAAVVVRLPSGVRLSVRRVLWRNFNQWAETRLGGKPGFVVVTSLEVSGGA